ncbi:MAG: hypothetical protein KatS3mg009_0859 [Acidimicrobiia bacterium]|nr:MAG: hypothetical protein KatS3mg009_0859 [Acidimicrobiia bacterium]
MLVALVASGCLSVSFRAGGTDPAGVYAGGTEVVALVPHGGALFAATSYANDVPGGDPEPGAQVLRLDGAAGAWRVDVGFGAAVRGVTALREVTFTTDGAGVPLPEPYRVLVAALSAEGGGHRVAVRDPGGGWTVQTVAPGDGPVDTVHALGFLRDGAVDRLFAGFGDPAGAAGAGVTSAVYDPAAPGRVRWAAAPEAAFEAPPLAFAVAEGALHAAAGASVYRRDPGTATWAPVHTDAATATCTGAPCGGLRGLTAVPDADGTGEDLLVAGAYAAAAIWRLDPEQAYSAVRELDVNDFLRTRHGPGSQAAVVGYDGFVPATDARTGRPFHLVPLRYTPDPGPRVDGRKAFFLVRGPGGDYELREVPWHENPHGAQAPQELGATRTFAVSPFPEHAGRAYYVGGFDASSAAHDTAWIDVGLLDTAAPTSTCLAQPPVPPPAAYQVGVADPPALHDPARDRTIPYRAYYPRGFTGRAPVVIVAHGGTGAPRSHQNGLAYLGRALAGAGYVAVHPNFTSDTPAIDRPLDVQFVLDRIDAGTLAVPGFGGTPDAARVGVAGHSYGAYTALTVAGATTTLTATLGDFAADPRPKAFLGLSPQGVDQFGFTADSWAGITRPVYTMYGELEADGSAVDGFKAETWRRQPYEGMPAGNKFVSVLPDADHDAFNNGTTAVDLATQAFVAPQAVAFFDTFVKGGPSRVCEIGNLVAPPGTATDRK